MLIIKVIVPDLFAEIHKSFVKFALLSSLYTLRFQLIRGFLNHVELKFY